MASPAPSNSQPQPLHNFPLSHLKWSTRHQRHRSSPNSASRLSSASPHDSPPPQHHSPLRHSLPPIHSPLRGGDATSASSPVHSPLSGGEDSGPPIRDSTAAGKTVIEYRRQTKVPTPSSPAVGDPGSKDSRPSKFLIKIRQNSGKAVEDVKGKAEVLEEGGFDEEPKIWNLRPRKPIKKSLNLNGGAFKNVNEASNLKDRRSQSPGMNPNSSKTNSKNKSDAQKKEKKNKNNFTLTLSREEIEEDIYSLFGTKLPRRPKKRQKAAQRMLDNLFPGAWLPTVTADSYKVSEHPGKA